MHWPFPEQDALVQALGWTLLHSLWQGLLLALVAGLVMLLTKNVRAGARYIMLVLLMGLFLAAATGTFIHEIRLPAPALLSTVGRQQSTIPATVYEEGPAGNALLPALTDNITTGHNRFTDEVITYFNTHAPLIVLVWFIIFSARFVKLLAGLLQVQRLRHHKTNTLSGYWTQRVQNMAESLRIRRRLQLLESAMVQVPVVMGVFKPVILIPLGLITHLPAQQVEAILWHELGHIKRKDYLVNLLQSFAETIFFFNPAILWISSLVREERENCCDDIALSGS
ncbi:MAG TPA: M56 family metallopeptidase, partial [Chitinophagaceae bacterium]|nr:M56 family metallopeptidase [Chitinophagaceae bacterium]